MILKENLQTWDKQQQRANECKKNIPAGRLYQFLSQKNIDVIKDVTLRLRQSCIDTKWIIKNSLTLRTLFDTVSLYQYKNITHCTTFQGNQLYIDYLGRREKLNF